MGNRTFLFDRGVRNFRLLFGFLAGRECRQTLLCCAGLLTFLRDTEKGFWHCWQLCTAESSVHCASFSACCTSRMSSYFSFDLSEKSRIRQLSAAFRTSPGQFAVFALYHCCSLDVSLGFQTCDFTGTKWQRTNSGHLKRYEKSASEVRGKHTRADVCTDLSGIMIHPNQVSCKRKDTNKCFAIVPTRTSCHVTIDADVVFS